MEGLWHGLVGFRFHPTEEEIISYYLEGKMRGLDFPVPAVADVVNICEYDPWELPQVSPMSKEEPMWYFFHTPVSNGKGINRVTKSGSWKETGKLRRIKDKQGKEIGLKKNFVFYKGRGRGAKKTNWVIHEFSHVAASYPKEHVLCRLKRKSGDKPDTCNEHSPPWASDSGNHAAENTSTQISHSLFEELFIDDDRLDYIPIEEPIVFDQGISNSNGFDHNTVPSWLSMFQQQQGTSNSNGCYQNNLSSLLVQQLQGTVYSDGFINERSLLNDSSLETSEQEDAFVDSLLVDQDECSGEINVNTLLHDFNPSKPLSGVYVGDSCDTDTEMPNEQGLLLETSGLFYQNAGSKGHSEMAMFSSPFESSCSSDNDGIMELDISSVNSDTESLGTFCLDVVDEFPTNTRTCKAQHTPKSHKYFEAQCSLELQMQSNVSHKAVSNVEMGENSIVKPGRDKQVAQTSSAKSSSSSSSNRSGSSNTKEFPIFRISADYCSDGVGSNNRKGSFISLETPQLSRKTYPPSVYLFNVLVSLVLIIFTFREMVYLH